LKVKIVRDEFFRPIVLRKVVTENELGVVAVTEEVALCNWFDLVVVEFESMFIGELNNAVLETSD
jgi:hypothetical protein